ncbi:RcnB family protein [Sphingomonas sp. DT-204]|uniref:RcnB family protein n=1 Tax=Sphingomonas sp. DT-204 TaxID=3396166 RepID=UPI003F1CDC1C
MRAYWITAAAIAAIAAAAPAEAQRAPRGQWSGPPRTTPMPARPQGWHGGNWNRPRPTPGHHRWGGRVNGRWYAGVYAPGGWGAYRRPVRGWVLPRYWFAPTFYVTDFATYGLGAPPHGYNWVRYYDDAVLVDGYGRVQDSVSGIDWDRYDGDPAYPDDGYAYDEGYAEPGAPYPPPPERRDDGVGGAVIGGVVGGVAGNVIAGRGDKLGGTLLGAGVGALAGGLIDKAEDDRRRRDVPPPPPYGAPYPEPGYPGGAWAYPPPPVVYAPPAEVVQPAPYHGGHHVYAGGTQPYTTVVPGPYGSVTTVTVIPAVTTTTTTTEYVYEAAPVRTYRKVVRRAACKCKYVRR